MHHSAASLIACVHRRQRLPSRATPWRLSRCGSPDPPWSSPTPQLRPYEPERGYREQISSAAGPPARQDPPAASHLLSALAQKLALDRFVHQTTLGLDPASPTRQILFKSGTTDPSGPATKRIRSSAEPLSRVTIQVLSFISCSTRTPVLPYCGLPRTSDVTRALYQSKSPTTTRKMTGTHSKPEPANQFE